MDTGYSRSAKIDDQAIGLLVVQCFLKIFPGIHVIFCLFTLCPFVLPIVTFVVKQSYWNHKGLEGLHEGHEGAI